MFLIEGLTRFSETESLNLLYINNCRLLQNNGLSGPIPDDIGALSELQTLDLSSNQFEGGIPSSLGFLTHLNYL